MKAIAPALVIVLLFGYCCVALTGWHKDNLAGPVMALLAPLILVLSVGLVERRCAKSESRDELDQPPSRRHS